MGASATAVRCHTTSKLTRTRSGSASRPLRRPAFPPDSFCGGLGRGLFIGCVGVAVGLTGAPTIGCQAQVIAAARGGARPRERRHEDKENMVHYRESPCLPFSLSPCRSSPVRLALAD